jgi:hypothetical protein
MSNAVNTSTLREANEPRSHSKIETLVEEISCLTLLETSELVKTLKVSLYDLRIL